MANGTSIELVGPVKFKGDLSDGKNLSAVGRVGELLVVAGDEDDRLQILRRHGDEYELLADRAVPMNAAGEEADVEGIACEGDLVYAVGSHAAKRTKVKETESRAENRRRLEVPEPRSAFRDVLVRFRLAADGSHSDYKPTTLRPLIDGTKVLEPFTRICCKENGIDIEGLAVKDGRLYIGFRGPVLQHGYVPVLKCQFADPITVGDLVYLNLGGRGVRDFVRVSDGFLVLAGPANELIAPYHLYWWDGNDCVPGAEGGTGRVVFLGELPLPEGAIVEDAKAEGLTVEAETASHYVVLALYDGLKKGAPQRYRVRRPG